MPLRVLAPGNFLFTHEAQQVSTVLGSCVAVCLFCPRTHHAALCHAMLPRPGAALEHEAVQQHLGRYVSEVLPHMIHQFTHNGCTRGELVAKVFGGASITPKIEKEEMGKEIGLNNVTTALGILLEAGIPMRAIITGGNRGHHIIFDTATGEILHRLLDPAATLKSLHHG
jgi:chemotaxis protein CheD